MAEKHNKYGPLTVQTWISFIQGCFVPSCVEIEPVLLERKLIYFRYLTIISTLKRSWPFIFTNLSDLYPRMILPSSFEMFLWNGLSSSREDICYIVKVFKSFDAQVPQIRMKYNFENFQITFVTLFNSFNDIQDMVWHIHICFFWVFRPILDFYNHIKTSPLPCHTCCDTGHLF